MSESTKVRMSESLSPKIPSAPWNASFIRDMLVNKAQEYEIMHAMSNVREYLWAVTMERCIDQKWNNKVMWPQIDQSLYSNGLYKAVFWWIKTETMYFSLWWHCLHLLSLVLNHGNSGWNEERDCLLVFREDVKINFVTAGSSQNAAAFNSYVYHFLLCWLQLAAEYGGCSQWMWMSPLRSK